MSQMNCWIEEPQPGKNWIFMPGEGGFVNLHCNAQIWLQFTQTHLKKRQRFIWEWQPPNHSNAGYAGCRGLWLHMKHCRCTAGLSTSTRAGTIPWTAALIHLGIHWSQWQGTAWRQQCEASGQLWISAIRRGERWLFWCPVQKVKLLSDTLHRRRCKITHRDQETAFPTGSESHAFCEELICVRSAAVRRLGSTATECWVISPA